MVVLNIAARWSAPARMLHHLPALQLIAVRHRLPQRRNAHFSFLSQATELIIWQYLATILLFRARLRMSDSKTNKEINEKVI
jgi:hypothetical protein